MAHNIIETIGSITKMEILESLWLDTLQETLVLKNIQPFPGYKCDENKKNIRPGSQSVFIMLRNQYASEQINTIFQKLVHDKIVRYYPSYGEIITSGSIYACVRFKDLQNFALIPYIQQYLVKNGLQLMKFRNLHGFVSIKIFKSFRILKIAEDLYRDANDVDKIYIRIPISLNWDTFNRMTKKVKSQFDNANFDAALGSIYRFCGTEDVLRIFDREMTLEKAKTIKMLYLEEIKAQNLTYSRNLQYEN